jgi:hypothetical protein
MPATPIAHFHGKFQFHMPQYNNAPRNPGVPFDPTLARAAVLRLCGCDPAHYFEFRFLDVKITQITYQDGTVATESDPVIGQAVELAGLLPDVSPSAICAQLYAGRLRVGNLLQGSVRKAIQSDLRLNIRPLGFTDETAAAHFDTALDIQQFQALDGSRFSEELGQVVELEFHFHLNHYTRLDNPQSPEEAKLMGDVYGYMRPSVPLVNQESGLRVKGRRLVAHPQIGDRPEIEQLFLTNTGTTPLLRITDIDGTYDFLEEDRLLTLRYLDFVPFLDRDYSTPTSRGEVDHFNAYFETTAGRIEVGRFTGDHEEMKRVGGLLTFPLPSEAIARDDMRLCVDVVKANVFTQPLMIESDWDLSLLTDRGVTLASGEAAPVIAKVFHRNRPAPNHPVRLRTQSQNPRSPIVARFNEPQLTTDDEGQVRAVIQALNLNDAGSVFDPVTLIELDQLPRDRYYGNYVYLAIDNPLRRANPPVEEIEIAVRVLHKVSADLVPAQPTFERDIRPLFSYHDRYYPWLHVREVAGTYVRFLDISNYDSFSDHVAEVIRRLEMEDHELLKMPRSRDFPIGGIEVIKRWFSSGMLE